MIFECKECKVKINMNDPCPNPIQVKVKFCPNCGVKIIDRPKININFETQPLIDMCEKYIIAVDNGVNDETLDDFEHFIFEKTMETVYGKDVWDYINERMN